MPSESANTMEQPTYRAFGIAAIPLFSQSYNAATAPKGWASDLLGLALAGLALAVALWGFGYKLSQFNLHSDALWRTSFAKLWDKQPNAPKVVQPSKWFAPSTSRSDRSMVLS